MKTKILLMALGLVAAMAAVILAEGKDAGGEGGAQETEITKNPAALLSNVKAGEMSVYGVRLGDPVEKIPGSAGVTGIGVPERSQDTIYTGHNVRYYANDKKIYRITILDDLARQLPTYDAARLQMALGKADEVVESPAGENTRLSFFARHVRFTVHAYRSLSLVTEVDLYAP